LKKREWVGILIETLKWGVVIWLLWPLQRIATRWDAVRVVAGITLFLIFTGKLFFDTIIMSWVRRRSTSNARDWLTLVGIVLGIGLVLGGIIILTGMVLMNMAQSGENGF